MKKYLVIASITFGIHSHGLTRAERQREQLHSFHHAPSSTTTKFYAWAQRERFTVSEQGIMARMDQVEVPPEWMKKYVHENTITVCGNAIGAAAISKTFATRQRAVRELLDRVLQADASIVEICFDGWQQWGANVYKNYKIFLHDLGTALHAIGKKLAVEGPLLYDALSQRKFFFRYEEIDQLPVDYLIIEQDDRGDHVLFVRSIAWVQEHISDGKKLKISIPIHDKISFNVKRALIESLGITSVFLRYYSYKGESS